MEHVFTDLPEEEIKFLCSVVLTEGTEVFSHMTLGKVHMFMAQLEKVTTLESVPDMTAEDLLADVPDVPDVPGMSVNTVAVDTEHLQPFQPGLQTPLQMHQTALEDHRADQEVPEKGGLDALILTTDSAEEVVAERLRLCTIADLIGVNVVAVTDTINSLQIPLEIVTKARKGKRSSHVVADMSRHLRPLESTECVYDDGVLVSAEGMKLRRSVPNAQVFNSLCECAYIIQNKEVNAKVINSKEFPGHTASRLAGLLNCRTAKNTAELKALCIARLHVLKNERIRNMRLTQRSHQRTMENGGKVNI